MPAVSWYARNEHVHLHDPIGHIPISRRHHHHHQAHMLEGKDAILAWEPFAHGEYHEWQATREHHWCSTSSVMLRGGHLRCTQRMTLHACIQPCC